MATRKTSLPTKKRILAVCAKLMLRQGYRDTTIKEIADSAGVSVSSVQNFYRSKEALLTELTKLMFAGQFTAARQSADNALPPAYVYAAETAIQLALTEKNENLREIYTEAYTLPDTVEYIYQNTAKELKVIFASRFPDYEESDFYEMVIGSAGLMRSYMARPCDIHFPMRRKLDRFITSSLRIYCVPESEIAAICDYVRTIDLDAVANEVIKKLFDSLESYFESV